MAPPDEAAHLQRLVAQLQEALATQPVIEQAKGMLMLSRSWSADEAFDALREISQRTNTKLHDVAATLVSTGSGRESAPIESDVTESVLEEISRVVVGGAVNRPPPA